MNTALHVYFAAIYIGRITHLARPSVCLSVCPRILIFVRFSLFYEPGTLARKTKKNVQKSKSARTFAGRVSVLPVFSEKSSKIKVTGRQKPSQSIAYSVYVLTGDQAQAGQAPTETRSMPLLGLIYCQCMRRSTVGRTAACHVVSRWRHTFLFMFVLCDVFFY